MKTHLLLALVLSCSALCAIAQEIRIPLGDQSDQSIAKPARGLSTDAVEQQFGNPESRHGPVGSPPIYYWEYKNFTVYFENSYVLHAVSKLKSKTPAPTN